MLNLYIIFFCITVAIALTLVFRFFIKKHLIAHAMGSIHGYRYTNSLEAFKKSYAKGFRQFETDIYLTTDNKIVCFHPLDNINHPIHEITSYMSFSYEEFKSGAILDKIDLKLTFLDIDDLIRLMEKYKDIEVLLHIFETDSERYEYIFDEFIKRSNPDVINRIIFQPLFLLKESINERKNKIKNIMTWVRKEDFANMEGVVEFLKKNNLRRIVTNKGNKKYIKELKKRNNSVIVQIYPEESIINMVKYIFIDKADLIVTHGDLLKTLFHDIAKTIFSVQQKNNHKIITILGIKTKLKLVQTLVTAERERVISLTTYRNHTHKRAA